MNYYEVGAWVKFNKTVKCLCFILLGIIIVFIMILIQILC